MPLRRADGILAPVGQTHNTERVRRLKRLLSVAICGSLARAPGVRTTSSQISLSVAPASTNLQNLGRPKWEPPAPPFGRFQQRQAALLLLVREHLHETDQSLDCAGRRREVAQRVTWAPRRADA